MLMVIKIFILSLAFFLICAVVRVFRRILQEEK